MPDVFFRDVLRGSEERIFDVISEVLTREQWSGWLKTVLEITVAKGDEDLSRMVVDAGAEFGNALHQAVVGGHQEIVENLLENGASPSARLADDDEEAEEYYGVTPLHAAAGHGQFEIMRLLLSKGAVVDAPSFEGSTALHWAVLQYGRVDVVEALLAARADVSLRFGDQQRSALDAATEKGNVEIMRVLIKHGADVNAVNAVKGAAALHRAAMVEEKDAIDVLVAAGADVNVQNKEGITPLHVAVLVSNREAVFALLKHGAKVNLQNNTGEPPLHIAVVSCGRQGAAEVLDLLLRHGADETIRDNDHLAATDKLGSSLPAGDDFFPEDLNRATKLLANAPIDRAWRRRGFVVLCRAHPDRLQRLKEIGQTHAATTPSARGSSSPKRKEARNGQIVDGNCTRGGMPHSEWSILAARVLGLQEEGLFRRIVGYL